MPASWTPPTTCNLHSWPLCVASEFGNEKYRSRNETETITVANIIKRFKEKNVENKYKRTNVKVMVPFLIRQNGRKIEKKGKII